MPVMWTCADFLRAPRSSAPIRIKFSLSPEHGRHLRPGADWRFAGVGSAKLRRSGICVFGLALSNPWKERSGSFPAFLVTRPGPPAEPTCACSAHPLAPCRPLAKNCAGAFQQCDRYGCGSVKAGSFGGWKRSWRTVHWLSSHDGLGTERIRCCAGNLFERAFALSLPQRTPCPRPRGRSQPWEIVGCRLVECP